MQETTSWALTDLSGNNIEGTELGGRVVVRIAGETVPCVAVQLAYTLNSIPQATVTLALGRDIRTLTESPVYAVASKFSQMAEVLIYVEGNLGEWSTAGNAGVKQAWPTLANFQEDEEQNKELAVLFTGYVANINFKRDAQSIALQVTAVNRLADLTMSSVGSSQVLPGSPVDFFTSPLYQTSGAFSLSPIHQFVQSLNNAALEDMSTGLLDVFIEIANAPDLAIDKSPIQGPLRANTRALDAIKPEAPKGYWLGIDKYANDPDNYLGDWTVPYSMSLSQSSLTKLVEYLSGQIQSSVAGGTFWNVLVGNILPSLGMAMIPMARAAIMAPVMPLNREHSIAIGPRDYVDFHTATLAQRPLYGVAVYGTQSSGTNFGETINSVIGSNFVPDEDAQDGDGAWMFAPIPPWLDDLGNRDVATAQGNPAAFKAINNPIGALGNVPETTPPSERDMDVEAQENAESAELYARTLYVANALRGREGMMTGKLRFDVTPGCTILIGNQDRGINGTVPASRQAGENLAADDETTQTADTLSHNSLAFVTKVTITIDAQNARGTTSFLLSNIRTEVENASKRFAIDRHPFFGGNFFKYAPLVPELSQPLEDE